MLYIESFNNKRESGLTGVMRVKNESKMIKTCIDSCIEALDELIVVCNDCTDNTPEILKCKQRQYPNKLKIYEYNHNVLSFNLTEDEFEEAINLPDDSVRLYANMCNYGLSLAKYKYVTKIDTDQLYFAKELKKWRDICANPETIKWKVCMIWGWLFMMYFSLYRRISVKLAKPCLFMLPDWLVTIFYESYQKYAVWQLAKGKVAVALSGINVFKDKEWFVTFDNINGHPPYNGTGDTVIFKLSEKTYFTRQVSRKYSSVTECFTQPYKVVFTSPMWFHQHANRVQCFDKIKKVKDECPEQFVPISDFLKMSYKEVHEKLNQQTHTLFQRVLFALIHKCKKQVIEDNLSVLENLGVK